MYKTNKFFCKAVTISLFLAISLLTSVNILLAAETTPTPALGKVEKVNGVIKDKNGVEREASFGMEVFEEENIITNANGGLEITLVNGEKLTLSASTEIHFGQMLNGQITIQVISGSIIQTNTNGVSTTIAAGQSVVTSNNTEGQNNPPEPAGNQNPNNFNPPSEPNAPDGHAGSPSTP